MTKNVNNLLQSASADGSLSPESLQALTVTDVGAQIQAGLGVKIDDVPASEVVLVTMLVDDSGSLDPNAELAREGHNLVLDALLETKQQDKILVHTRYLNGKILFPFRLLEDAQRMDKKNYHPAGGTPLYDQTFVTLGTIFAKTQECLDSGIAVRTITLIITDGGDNASPLQNPQTVANLVRDMLKTELHLITGLGISDGVTDFEAVFRGMGIPDQSILTVTNSQSEIRKVFNLVSRSIAGASQSAGAFKKAQAGGFGAP